MIWINTHSRHSYQHFGAGLHNVEGANIMQAKEVMTLPVVSVEPECHNTAGHSDHAAKADQRIAGD